MTLNQEASRKSITGPLLAGALYGLGDKNSGKDITAASAASIIKTSVALDFQSTVAQLPPNLYVIYHEITELAGKGGIYDLTGLCARIRAA